MHTRQSSAKADDCGNARPFGATERKNNDSTFSTKSDNIKNSCFDFGKYVKRKILLSLENTFSISANK